MFQPVHPTSPSAFSSALSRCFLAACGASLLVACGAESTGPEEPGAGSGGSAAGSGAGTGGAGSGGAGAGGSNAAGSAGGSGSGGSGESSLYGYFNIVLNPKIEETDTPANTTLLGKLYDGANPTAMNWQKKDEADDCRLDVPNAILCQPACGTTGVCTATNTCSPYAMPQTAGTAKLKGLGASELSMEPRANNYQLPAGTMLGYPPCTEGSKIELAADGGGHGAFKIEAQCIAPLETAATVMVVKGQPLALRWKAPTATGTRVTVLLDISQHGTSKGKIECDTADDGVLDIPVKLIDALVDLGISGFPTVLLTRETEGKSGNVVLNVSAPFRSAVEIPGLTSCTEDTDCPMGQKCLTDLKCG